MPCDGLEQTRLEILHRLYLTALDGALTTAPLPPGLQRVLDVGTGPGEWASQMAEQFPDAEIVAVDLAVWELPAREASDDDSSCDEIDPRANIVWEIDDLEPYSQPHSPVNPASPPELAQVTADVEGLTIDQGYASGSTTAEGGAGGDDADGENKPPSSKGSHRSPPRSPSPHHQEQQQPHPKLLGADLTVDDGWNFSEPFDFVHMRDLKGAFRDWRAVYREAFLFIDAGFCDVQRHCVDVPMGPWPDDPRLSSMGKMWLVCCAEGLEAGCLRLLTRYSGWDAEDVKRKAREARREMLEGRCGGVVTKLWFVTARKAKRRAR
ncbi:putative tam domain methyltransferase protein [Lasiodiplodia theobromae]|nr:putative tam domain methyltransferase protein [Lasiodiplodia theobromae]